MGEKTGHFPQNKRIKTIMGRAEIFWQTANALHICQESSRSDHLNFQQISDLLEQFNLFFLSKGKWIAFAPYGNAGNYYQTAMMIRPKADDKSKLFAVILSCRINNDQRLINAYKKAKAGKGI